MKKKKPTSDEVLRQVAAKLEEASDELGQLQLPGEVKLLGEEIRDVLTRVRQAADTVAAA